jgi:hypothetical protein
MCYLPSNLINRESQRFNIVTNLYVNTKNLPVKYLVGLLVEAVEAAEVVEAIEAVEAK